MRDISNRLSNWKFDLRGRRNMSGKYDQSTTARAKQRIVAHMGVGIAFGLAIGTAAGNAALGLIGGIILGVSALLSGGHVTWKQGNAAMDNANYRGGRVCSGGNGRYPPPPLPAQSGHAALDALTASGKQRHLHHPPRRKLSHQPGQQRRLGRNFAARYVPTTADRRPKRRRHDHLPQAKCGCGDPIRQSA